MPKMPKIITTPSLPIPANQNDPVDRSEKLAYTVVEAASALGVGRSTLFDMIRTGELQARKLRGRTVVTRAELVRILSDAPIRTAQAA